MTESNQPVAAAFNHIFSIRGLHIMSAQDEMQAFWDQFIVKHGVPTCAVCHGTTWRLGTVQAVPVVEADGSISAVGGTRTFMLPVVCTTCRQTLLFTGDTISFDEEI
jgi:hypothetical protein